MEERRCIRLEADAAQLERCRQRLLSSADDLSRLAGVLHLLGNETRLKILYTLNLEGRLCVCDLSDILGLSISAVSQHLRKIKDRDLVFNVREGQTIYYSLSPDFKPIFDGLVMSSPGTRVSG